MAEYGYLKLESLHSRPDQATAKIVAAYDAGAGVLIPPSRSRRMSFAQDALVGNIATETVIEALGKRGAQLPPLKSLDALVRVTAEIGARYTASTARIENAQKTTMNYKTLTLTLDSALATITLNRPDKRNAVSYELIDDLIRRWTK